MRKRCAPSVRGAGGTPAVPTNRLTLPNRRLIDSPAFSKVYTDFVLASSSLKIVLLFRPLAGSGRGVSPTLIFGFSETRFWSSQIRRYKPDAFHP